MSRDSTDARPPRDPRRGAAFLSDDVDAGDERPAVVPPRVAANMLGIVERELAQPAAAYAGDDWASLANAVHLKLAVANPKHLQA